ncbi:MAG TPA: antibiotic ABC transporter ATP-binding protein [Elusimicrobia bacterium]|nr:antibiotic ABC transporter ATP-binding protein [Elusimicrobiota bacterium]
MTAMDDDDDPGKGRIADLRLLRRFLGYLRPHLGPVVWSGLLLFAGIGAELAAPFLLRQAIDGPVAAGDPEGLWRSCAVFFGVVVLTGILKGVEHYTSNLAGQRVIYDLRTELFGHLQKLPVAYFDRNPVGRLMTRVTGDIETLSEFFSSGLMGLFSSSLLLVAAFSAMLWVDWRLTLWTMAALPLAMGVAAAFRHYGRKAHRDARKAVAAVSAFLNESIGGVKTIQIFNREADCLARFDKKGEEFLQRSLFTALVYSLFWPGIEVVTTLATAILLWFAGNSILAKTMTFGSFLAFWYLVRKFFEPFYELADKYNILQAAMASSERVFRILDTEPGIASPAAPAAPPVRGEIVFEDVGFSYDGKTPVLQGLSFRVRPGEKVALVGYTGGGKTSVLSLLLRLYDVSSGRILVDGTDVREYDPRELRRRFGMVFQDVFLFSGTVEENISLGEELPRSDLERAVLQANAEPIVARLPDGYQSKIHERGAALSAGERQLLSFARALAASPPIMVLDEATSSVDAETEGLIQDAMGRILEGRTAVIVAHRLSTIRRVDRILVLHKGTLREEGTHAELLARGGLYEKLYRLQWQPAPAR